MKLIKKIAAFNPVILALAVALAGSTAFLFPAGNALEENLGLDLLFNLRGQRPAPPGVVVVAMEKGSSDALDLHNNPEKWPRTVHAQLIDKISGAGAALVVFDIHFKEARAAAEDAALIAAMKRAGNVILPVYLEREVLEKAGGTPFHLERVIPPAPLIADAALAVAPFVLPKVPAKVSRFWTLQPGAGDVPTLPRVALEHFAAAERPTRHMDRHPYLNLYGPPRTVATVPYLDVLQGSAETLAFFKNKVVFVGFAEWRQPEQRDGFYTAFSQPDGLDLSGVEILATAFANLLEDRTLVPLPPVLALSVIAAFGFLVTLGCRLLPLAGALGVSLGAGAVYTLTALYFFSAHDLWLPLAIPLLFQMPLALLAGIGGSYLATRRAFRHYVPSEVVDKLSRENRGIHAHGETRFGVCLATDAENYTRLAESMEPEALRAWMNEYYQRLFQPVRQRGGMISDVIGDAMLAIWPDADARAKACGAALEIMKTDQSPLRTRIGLHCGEMLLGNVGALDHVEYRAVGDVVNTASRIQGLNKTLGTRVLASDAVVREIVGLRTRPLGLFLLAGKTQPLAIHEILPGADPSAPSDPRLEAFAGALKWFAVGDWQRAQEAFAGLLTTWPEDGPARFFLAQSKQHCVQPPARWDGILRIVQK